MKKYIVFLIAFLFFKELIAQKNYIIPEPQKILFPESKQNGFRLSKKTSLQLSDIDGSVNFIENFRAFVKNETGFELSSKINKKSNILLRVSSLYSIG